MTAPSTGRPVRRPRLTPEREHELLLAAIEVLRETGYEALTMEGVAARARCGKATLYRLFSTKQKMIARALRATRLSAATPLDTGSLRGDLLAFTRRVAGDVDEHAATVWAVAHASLEDGELRHAIQAALVDEQGADMEALIARAVARGELRHRPAAAAHLSHIAFGAAIVQALDVERISATAYVAQLVDDVLLPALHHS